MADRTAIEWADATWNPIRARNLATGKLGWFCTHASDGCRNCYAEAINRRLGTGVDFKAQLRDRIEIFVDETMLAQPLRWRRPRKIFVGSMTDIGGDFVTDEMLDMVWAAMAVAPWHIFQVLSKRPDRIRAYVASIPERLGRLEKIMSVVIDHPTRRRALWKFVLADLAAKPLKNLWLGASAEDQTTADKRLPELLATPAAVRFLSAEPLLERIDIAWALHRIPVPAILRRGRFRPGTEILRPLDLVIVGGESGPGARPCWTPAVRSIVNQCGYADVPVFVKQMGSNVQDRDDAGFDGCDDRAWPEIDLGRIVEDPNGYRDDAQGVPVRVKLFDRKGGDPGEWPPDLRVRQYPGRFANLKASPPAPGAIP